MIQELFGGNLSSHTAAGGMIVGEKETSQHITGVVQPSPLPSPSSSTTKTSSENPNPLRCPRCDSSNTKFCYYNNYNLTQPRHFCKTCRRYWTKGGALRNVPIGGGCRKNNKTNYIGHAIQSSLGKTCTEKSIRSHPTNSLLWTSPQTSHLLALLRSNQTQNPNPNPNFNYSMKEEGFLSCGSGDLRLDPYNSRQIWRNDEQSQAQSQQQSGGFILQNISNPDQMYNQRVSLKSAENYYSDNYAPLGNVHASSSNCSGILESAPVIGGVSCWNNTSLSRPDLPTTNGAYYML